MEAIALFIVPLVLWVGVMAWMRTFEGEITQLQSTVLFGLAFLLLASLVFLNVAVHSNVVLLTVAVVETITVCLLTGFKIKKLVAEQ